MMQLFKEENEEEWKKDVLKNEAHNGIWVCVHTGCVKIEQKKKLVSFLRGPI